MTLKTYYLSNKSKPKEIEWPSDLDPVEKKTLLAIPKASNVSNITINYKVKDGHVVSLNAKNTYLHHLPKTMSKLTHLIKLDISHNYLENQHLKVLKPLKNLIDLNIVHNYFGRDKKLEFAINYLKQIPILEMDKGYFTKEQVSEIKNNEKLNELKQRKFEELLKEFEQISISKISKAKADIRSDGVILDSIEDIEYALRVYDGLVDGMYVDLSTRTQMHLPLAAAMAHGVMDIKEYNEKFMENLMKDIKKDLRKKDEAFYSFDGNVIATHFSETTIKINKQDDKYVLHIYPYFGHAEELQVLQRIPEKDLADKIEKPYFISYAEFKLKFEPVDEKWYNIDLNPIIKGLGMSVKEVTSDDKTNIRLLGEINDTSVELIYELSEQEKKAFPTELTRIEDLVITHPYAKVDDHFLFGTHELDIRVDWDLPRPFNYYYDELKTSLKIKVLSSDHETLNNVKNNLFNFLEKQDISKEEIIEASDFRYNDDYLH